MTDEYYSFARFYNPLLGYPLRPIRNCVLILLKGFRNFKILDLCCGTGDQLGILSQNGFDQLYGIDISRSMVKIAKSSCSSLNISLQDATKTGLKSGAFDIVMSSFALHEKDGIERQNVINEAYRLLKSNGLILIVDYFFDEKTTYWGRFCFHFIERIAGKAHYKNFLNFIKNNGVQNLIEPDKFSLVKQKRKLYRGIAVSIYKKISSSEFTF